MAHVACDILFRMTFKNTEPLGEACRLLAANTLRSPHMETEEMRVGYQLYPLSAGIFEKHIYVTRQEVSTVTPYHPRRCKNLGSTPCPTPRSIIYHMIWEQHCRHWSYCKLYKISTTNPRIASPAIKIFVGPTLNPDARLLGWDGTLWLMLSLRDPPQMSLVLPLHGKLHSESGRCVEKTEIYCEHQHSLHNPF